MNNKVEKVAIITGASRGIGRKIAEQLADLGVSVVINYHSNKQEADNVVEGIISNGGKAIAAYNGVFEQCFQKYLNTFDKNIF